MFSEWLFYLLKIMNNNERWSDIEGCKGVYIISNLGNIKRKQSVFNKNQYLSNTGYKFTTLKIKGKTRSLFIHRLVAKAFIANPENKPQVNHIDGNKTNNHYKNLEWCTRLENIHHGINTGLTKGKTAISSKCVLNVRRLYKTGDYTYRDLSKKFNISMGSVHNIINNKTRMNLSSE